MQVEDFASFFPHGTMFKESLDKHVMAGDFDDTKIHSALWKFYMLFQPDIKANFIRPEQWIQYLEARRKEYWDFKNQWLGVLSGESTDTEVKLLMTQFDKDIRRLRADVPFFKNESTRNTIRTLLFLHERMFPMRSYWQAFHDICGFTFWLMHHEMDMKRVDPNNEHYAITVLFDATQTEADTFWVFARVIEYAHHFYTKNWDDIDAALLSSFQNRDDDLYNEVIEHPAMKACLFPLLLALFCRDFRLATVSSVWSRIFSVRHERNLLFAVIIELFIHLKDVVLLRGTAQELIEAMHALEPEVIFDAVTAASDSLNETGLSKDDELRNGVCENLENWASDCLTKDKSQLIADLEVFRDIFNGMTSGRNQALDASLVSLVHSFILRSSPSPED